MTRVIYTDDQRTLSIDRYNLIIESKVSGRKEISLGSDIEEDLKSEHIAALKAKGMDPQGWYSLIVPRKNGYGGGVLAIMPPETRTAVAAVLGEYAADLAAKRTAWAPRRAVQELYDAAARLQDYPGEYFPALHRADEAYREWAQTHPEQALEEYIAELTGQAEHEDELASGALVYDADGSLSSDEQEGRAAEHRTKAQAIRKRIKQLEERMG